MSVPLTKNRLAIVGAGISGLSLAHALAHNPKFAVTLIEKETRLGGHSRTIKLKPKKLVAANPSQSSDTQHVDQCDENREISVDTGFIVMNDRNYPNLSHLFQQLGVKLHKTPMSFSFSLNQGEFEWAGTSLNTLFAQRKNLLNWPMCCGLYDVIKFNRQALSMIELFPGLSLGALLNKLNLGSWFREKYILPMGAAIWSCPSQQILEFPAQSFVRFFENHGLLSLNNRPQWYSLSGKSVDYVRKIEKILTNSCTILKDFRINSIKRTQSGVSFSLTQANSDHNLIFDQVIFACHPQQALPLIHDANQAETQILRKFSQQANTAYTHSDITHMPRLRRCWSSWNYLQITEPAPHPTLQPNDTAEAAAMPAQLAKSQHPHNTGAEHYPQALHPTLTEHKYKRQASQAAVTYWMNNLQDLNSEIPIFVTLNPIRPIDNKLIYDKHEFLHPIFDHNSLIGQQEIGQIQGRNRLWFCGAYLRYGFHEDGIWSALQIVEKLNSQTL